MDHKNHIITKPQTRESFATMGKSIFETNN